MSKRTNFKKTTNLFKFRSSIACMAESMSDLNDYLYPNKKEMNEYMQVQPLRFLTYEAKVYHADKISEFHFQGDDWNHLKGNMYCPLDIPAFDKVCKQIFDTTSKVQQGLKPKSRAHITIKLNPFEIQFTHPDDKYDYYDYKFYIARNYNIPLVINTGDPQIGCNKKNFVASCIIFQGVLNAILHRLHPILAKHNKISDKLIDKSCLVDTDWNELLKKTWNGQYGNKDKLPESFREPY